MNMFYTYILHSKELNKFYTGQTSDLEKRLLKHGKDRFKFTGKAQDWILIWSKEVETRSEAIKLETKIKNRGIERYLDDKNIKF